jgi:hypothetical protein
LQNQDKRSMQELDLEELYKSSKHRSAYKRASVAVVVAVLASIAWLALSFYKVITLRKESTELKSESARFSDLISKRKLEYDELEKQLKDKLQLTDTLASLLDVSPEGNSDAAKADRKEAKVQYFSKDIKPEALAALRQFGFLLEDKKPQSDIATSNPIWFGKHVSLDDVRLVAYVLFKSKFKIDFIKPFPRSSGDDNLIQIGALGKSTSNSSWTLEQIAGIKRYMDVDVTWLSGVWEGTAYQMTSNQTWMVKLEVQGGKYLVDYPTLKCEGEWTLLKKSTTTINFREKLTRGTDICEDNGYVIIKKIGPSQIQFNYTNPNGNIVTSSAVLNHTR